MQTAAIEIPFTPQNRPPRYSEWLRSGAIDEDAVIARVHRARTVQTDFIVPTGDFNSADGLISAIVHHLVRRPVSHLQTLVLGLFFDDFTLAVSPAAEAEGRSLAAVTTGNEQRDAAVAAAAARLDQATNINTALLGEDLLAENAIRLQPAFQPMQTPTAIRIRNEVQQQASVRRIRLRMPTVLSDGTEGEAAGPAAPEEQEQETGEEDGTQTVSNMEAYVDIKPKLKATDIERVDFYYPRNTGADNRLHYLMKQKYPGREWIPYDQMQTFLQSKHSDVTGGILEFWERRGDLDCSARANLMEHVKERKDQGPITEALIDKLPTSQAQALRYMRAADELDLYVPGMSEERAVKMLRRRRFGMAQKVDTGYKRTAYRKRMREEDAEDSSGEPSSAGEGGVKKPRLSTSR